MCSRKIWKINMKPVNGSKEFVFFSRKQFYKRHCITKYCLWGSHSSTRGFRTSRGKKKRNQIKMRNNEFKFCFVRFRPKQFLQLDFLRFPSLEVLFDVVWLPSLFGLHIALARRAEKLEQKFKCNFFLPEKLSEFFKCWISLDLNPIKKWGLCTRTSFREEN